MPIEVLRFGVGHRRPDGPPGTTGISGRVIHADGRGVISELAFARGARIEPHSNPNTTYFIVIEGGGWVGVGEEQLRVAAGDAVVWPPEVPHGAWTGHSEMRVFVVEFAGADDTLAGGILPGRAREIGPGDAPPPERGEGVLAPRAHTIERMDRSSGEPL
jgi:quercetin dioxygenase-like cupin family protein